MNQELYTNLAHAVDYFQCGQKFEELAEIEEFKIQSYESNFRERKKKGTSVFDILQVIAILALIGAGLVVLATIIMLLGDQKFYATDISILKALPFSIILPIILLVFIKRKNKAHEKKFQKIYQTEVLPQIEAAQAELAELENRVNDFVAKNLHLIEFLPMPYRHLQAVTYMFYSVANKRADTLKEAINLYEEQLHRWNLENAAQQAVEAQEYMALAMEELNMRQAETNNRLRAIEVMQYWEYLNGKSNN